MTHKIKICLGITILLVQKPLSVNIRAPLKIKRQRFPTAAAIGAHKQSFQAFASFRSSFQNNDANRQRRRGFSASGI